MDNRQQQAYNFFINKGYSREASAGIVGNLISESALKTGAEGDIGLKGGSSYGIAQWRLDRFTNLKEFAKNKNTDWKDFNTQLEYVDHELNSSYKSTKSRLSKATSPEEASSIFMNTYERPSEEAKRKSIAGRQQNARNLFGGKFVSHNYSETAPVSSSSRPVNIGSGEILQTKGIDYLPDETFRMQRDSSHVKMLDLPEVTEAKKDILANEIARNMEPQAQDATPSVIDNPVETVKTPTYNYLQQTDLFQL